MTGISLVFEDLGAEDKKDFWAPAVTFVTQAELTEWALRRQWGRVRQQRMAGWLSRIPVLHSNDDIAAIWAAFLAVTTAAAVPPARAPRAVSP